MKDIEVVISGIGGSFPRFTNYEDLKESLLAGVNLSENNPRNWRVGEGEAWHMGISKDSQNFDNSFFGITRNLCLITDHSTKKLLENTFESIVDAGINPRSLRNSKTAVIMVTGKNDWEMLSDVPSTDLNSHRILGQAKSMDSNRVSFFFSFTGPSYTMVTSEAGAIGAIQQAADMIKKGLVKQAVVGSSHIIMHPFHHYDKQLHLISKDGETRSFSEDADGFWKADATVVLFLQSKRDALRSYATVEKADCISFMDPDIHGIFHHQYMEQFLQDFYANEDVNDIGCVVADGIGIHDLDSLELNSLSSAIASKREEPLLVTSCKSMMGYSDFVCSLSSVLTAILALQTDTIIPVINYSKPNHKVPSLYDGSIKIVTENTKLKGDRVAVNAYAALWNEFGHLILRRNESKKQEPHSSIPYFVTISGRRENELNDALTEFKKKTTAGAVALIHKAFSQRHHHHTFRAYTTLTEDSPVFVKKLDIPRPKPVWFIYSGMGSQWPTMGQELMKIEFCADRIRKCHNLLSKEGLDLIEILTKDDKHIFDNILHSFVAITTIQIVLTDLLFAFGVEPCGMIGHSVGELGCSYADGCLTWEQTLMAACARGKASNKADLIPGMMAAVGLGFNQIENQLPEGIEVACHNSSSSCTLSGPKEIMEDYVSELSSKNIFARLVNVSNIAYHSNNIQPAAPYLFSYLEKVIPEPKKRSSKWISTSVLEKDWNTESAQWCSAQYHTNNLLSHVYFEEGCKHIPEDAICIEIAPHGLLQAIVKRSMSSCTHISLTNRSAGNPINFLLDSIGIMYTHGIDMDLSKLYPQVEFPVPSNTPSIQQLVTWEHTEKWCDDFFNTEETKQSLVQKIMFNQYNREFYKIRQSYIINNQSIFPCSYLLINVIKLFHKINKSKFIYTPVIIQDFEFKNVLFPDRDTRCEITLLIQGSFEIVADNQVIMSGSIIDVKDSSSYIPKELPYCPNGNAVKLSQKEIYSYWETFNYYFKGTFRSLNSILLYDQGFTCRMKIFGELEFMLDSLISSAVFHHMYENNKPVMISKIQSIAIDPKFLSYAEDGEIIFNAITNILCTNGICIRGLKMAPLDQKNQEFIELKKYSFVPYYNFQPKHLEEFFDVCAQFIVENTPWKSKTSLKTVISIIVKDSCANVPFTLNRILSQIAVCKVKTVSLSGISAEFKNSEDGFVVSYKGTTIPSQLYSLLSDNEAFFLLYVPAGHKANLLDKFVAIFTFTEPQYTILLIKKKIDSVYKNNVIKISSSDCCKQLTVSKTQAPQLLIMENMLLTDACNTIQSFIQKLPNNVRFIWLDQKSPAFDERSCFYQNIIKNNFKVTICLGGEFGSMKTLLLEGINNDKSALSTSSKEIMIIKSTCVDVKAVGVCFPDPVIPSTGTQVQALEFAGIKNGKAIMGLCRVRNGILENDPILIWEIPSKWTPQEAATVPLYYSMAYYIIIKQGFLREEGNVFIHAGYSLFSQAVIRVALSLGCRVLTTYYTEEQRNFICSTFPMLSKEDVIHCTKTEFGQKLMMATKGEGADIIVNTLGKKYVEVTQEIVNKKENLVGSRFIQVSTEPVTEDYTIGMFIFNYLNGMYCTQNETVLELDNEDKLWLKSKVSEGIKAGVIKPLNFLTVNSNLPLSQINSSAMNATVTLPMKKVVLSFDSAAKMTRGSRNSKNSILLIGNQNVLLCHHIINSFVSKAYRKFHLIMENDFFPISLSRRLKNLQRRNSDLRIECHQMKTLNSVVNCEALIKKIQEDSKLEFVFYFSSENEIPSHYIDLALRKLSKDSNVVTIGKSAQRLCEIRRKQGYNCTAFLHSQNMGDSSIILGIEKMLQQQNASVDTIYLNDLQDRVSDMPKVINDRLPQDINELLALRRTVRDDNCIIPLFTRGTYYHCLKDSCPIFMLPGLRVDKQINFVTSMPYSAFLVTIPTAECISTLAHIITQDIISNFPDLDVINILCEGWSGALALNIAHFLELRDKLCLIIMMDASPRKVQSSLNFVNDLAVISKYFNIDQEMAKRMLGKTSWKEKISEVLQLQECSQYDTDALETSLIALNERINLLKDFSISRLKTNAKVLLFMPTADSSKFEYDGIELACSKDVSLIQIDDDDVLSKASMDMILTYVGFQYDAMDPKYKDIEEITNPVYIKDITVLPMERTVLRMRHNREIKRDNVRPLAEIPI